MVRDERKKKIKIPSIFLRHVGTYCLNMMTSEKKIKNPHNFGRTWPNFFSREKKKKRTLGKKSITRGVKISYENF
jgi:hypothetical protein